MRDFTKVSTSIWESEKFRSLEGDSAKLFYLYLLTCEHNNSVGCFKYRPGYFAEDFGQSRDCIDTLSKQLADACLIELNDNFVRITGWFRFNTPMNGNHATAMATDAERIDAQVLKSKIAQELMEVLDGVRWKVGEQLRNRIETLSNRYATKPELEPDPEPEVEPDLDQNKEPEQDLDFARVRASDPDGSPASRVARFPSPAPEPDWMVRQRLAVKGVADA